MQCILACDRSRLCQFRICFVHLLRVTECLKLPPNYAPAHKNPGMALGLLGRRDEATSHLNEAVRLKPDCEYAKQQLRTLESQKEE
jgi:hypothetical protein